MSVSIPPSTAAQTPGARPNAGQGRRFGFLVKPGWLAAIAGALAFTAACWLILAPWQFTRHSERSAQNAAITAALSQPAVPVQDDLTLTTQPSPDLRWRRVTATGTFRAAGQFYVRLRQDPLGNPVTEVVTPLILDDGSVLLVDRGYVPADDIASGRGVPDLPAGPVSVTGRIQPEETDPLDRAPAVVDGRKEVRAINAKALPDADGGAVRKGYIQLVKGSPGVLTELGVPQIDSGPYLSYALQWCAFGLMSILAMGYFGYREATDPRDPEPGQAPPDRSGSPETRRPARRPRGGFDRSQLFDD